MRRRGSSPATTHGRAQGMEEGRAPPGWAPCSAAAQPSLSACPRSSWTRSSSSRVSRWIVRAKLSVGWLGGHGRLSACLQCMERCTATQQAGREEGAIGCGCGCGSHTKLLSHPACACSGAANKWLGGGRAWERLRLRCARLVPARQHQGFGIRLLVCQSVQGGQPLSLCPSTATASSHTAPTRSSPSPIALR